MKVETTKGCRGDRSASLSSKARLWFAFKPEIDDVSRREELGLLACYLHWTIDSSHLTTHLDPAFLHLVLSLFFKPAKNTGPIQDQARADRRDVICLLSLPVRDHGRQPSERHLDCTHPDILSVR
jgi:hypothetical protein